MNCIFHHVFKASSYATSPMLISQIIDDSKYLDYNVKSHTFILLGKETSHYKVIRENGGTISFFNTEKALVDYMQTLLTPRIIIHGLPYKNIFKDLFFSKISLCNIAWINWGHGHNYSKRELFKKLLDKYLMSKLNEIITLSKYDEFEVSKVYKWSNVSFLPYRSNNISKLFEKEVLPVRHNGFNILLGVSGGIPQKHVYGMQLISKLNLKNNNIYCPLSYNNSDQKYINTIKEEGQKRFGDSFFALEDLMSTEKYVDFLRTIDILLLPSLKQNGLFNIYVLLFLGKKVFVPKKSNIYYSLTKIGLEIEALEDIDLINATEGYNESVKNKNKEILSKLFNHKKSIDDLNKFYKSLKLNLS